MTHFLSSANFLIILSQVDNAPESDRKDLLSELELMKKLKPHPHVIKLIACVTETGKENIFLCNVTWLRQFNYQESSSVK